MIRKTTVEDLDRVVELENMLFTSPWKKEDFQYQIEKNEFSNDYVLEIDGKIIGYIGFFIIYEQAQITTIGIDKEYQGKGYSKLLMDFMCEKANEAGCENVSLEVRVSNTVAKNLYEKYGFITVNIRKGYYENPKEDAYLMIKPLGGYYA